MTRPPRLYSRFTASVLAIATSATLAAQGPEPRIDESAWYPFSSVDTTDPGVFGMNDWLEAPAGRHGRVTRDGEELRYNGRPFRIWGINNTFLACAPEKELAKRRAAFYAKYGINSVRLHKYADGTGSRGILTNGSFAQFDPEGLDRMDHYIAQLKERGIYVKLSSSFGPPVLGKADLERVPYLEEFGSFETEDEFIQVSHSAIFYSPEIQEIHIEQMVNLLQHHNPYTNLRYADDPAIWDIEIINEQSILFFTSPFPLEKSPTLRRQVGQRFSAWLEERYGDQEGLEAAWGRDALNSFELARNESLSEGTVLPVGTPSQWNAKALEGEEAYRRQRNLDTLEFLTMLQMGFYERYVNAVRETGYEGEISASNWQAGNSFSHFANLWTDAQVGTIDRHNYHGGIRRVSATGERALQNWSTLSKAGSGLLSTGMQQVADLPFMLSEWVHVWSNEWGVEGPAVIGAYGLGLQGWDVSYMFQNRDEARFSEILGLEDWDVTAPQVMGVFPAVARQVLRGDVETSRESIQLYAHYPSLFKGEGLDFDDQVDQGYDTKAFQSDKVSPRALAQARVEVVFAGSMTPTPEYKVKTRAEDGAIVSSTEQLTWVEADEGVGEGGYITIDTPGTQALVGFAQGKRIELGDVAIQSDSRFGAFYLTALDADASIHDAERLLITAIGRARNTGQRFSDDGRSLAERGDSPVLMEPLRATLTLPSGSALLVWPLDHDGRVDGAAIPIGDGVIEIDTGRHQTPYFLVERAAAPSSRGR